MIDDRLEQEVITHEGKSKSVYKDSLGYDTIGIGRMCDKRKNAGLSDDEMLYLLRNDLSKAKLELTPYSWFITLDDVRQGVLIEICFNIGLDGFLQFKRMIQALSDKDYGLSAKELINSLWSKQVGPNRSQNMANRLKTGIYES